VGGEATLAKQGTASLAIRGYCFASEATKVQVQLGLLTCFANNCFALYFFLLLLAKQQK
jgi:hypothetical protein